MVTPSRAFFDTSVLLGGLIELGPASEPAQKIMAAIAADRQVVTDQAAAEVLASHYAGSGPFTSVDAFFFWALDDRRLPLDQIVKYIEKTVEMQKRKA